MWFADIIVDLEWFTKSQGQLGIPGGRSKLTTGNAELQADLLLYGDDTAIRHLRLMLHTEQHEIADKWTDQHIQYLVNALEVASAIATPTFATAETPERNSATFMVILGEGDETVRSVELRVDRSPAPVADLPAAAQIMTTWKPDFRVHLHFLSRFLNYNLPADVRWLNGYRVLEWHFLRGRSGKLARDLGYQQFVKEHGADFDGHLREKQTRAGLIEEVRALVAHAILAQAHDPRSDKTSDKVLATFAALEALVQKLMNEGVSSGVTFTQR
jgi:hypothetical protein